MKAIKNYIKSLPQRWIVTVMSMMAVTIAFTMRSCLSMTMMQMVRPVIVNESKYVQEGLVCPMPSDLEFQSNGTSPVLMEDQSDRFTWDEETQGMILSAFYYGYIVTHIPGGWLAQRFGGKFPTVYTITSSSVLTLLTPTVAKIGPRYLIILRFIQGLGEGILFPALCNLMVQWAPPQEKGKLSTLVFSGVAIGQIVANLFSGIIIDCIPGGWPNVFYCFGIIALIWLTVWLSIVFNDPISSPLISSNEYKYLNDTIGYCQRKNHLAPTPWCKIILTPAVWALIAVEIGFDWGQYTIANDLPKYMNDVLHFSKEQNGFLSSTPYLAQWSMASLSGIASDYLITKKYLTVTRVRKIGAVIGTVGPGLGVMCASFSGCHRLAATFFFNSGMLLMGFCYPSIRINALDLSPNYSPSIMALVNGIGCLSGMASPFIVGLLTPDRTVSEWRIVFWIMCSTMVTSAIIYSIFGSAELQPWNSEKSSSTKEKSIESNDVDHTTQSKVPTTTKNIIN